MNRILRTISWVGAALLFGCGTGAERAPEAATQPPQESLYGEDADTPRARFTVEIPDGDYAGTYELFSFDPRPCHIGMTGVNMFSFNASGRSQALYYADTFIPNFQTGGGRTEVFAFTARAASFDFSIDTRPDSFHPGGSGTATYTDDGADGIRIQIQGRSRDGVEAKGSLECFRVGRTGQ